MAGRISGIAGEVTALIEPTVNELGYSLWDVEYVKEGATWYLRVTIDSPDGIDLNACEKVHRAIDPVLDEADPIEDAYVLEVSSPGLERTIRKKEHYLACRGEKVQIRLFRPVDGLKSFVGRLETDESCEKITVVTDDGKEHVFDRAMVAKANVFFEM